MTIHWLNSEMTEAIVERGWFRRRRATVKLSQLRYGSGPDDWKFVSGNDCPYSLKKKLHRARERELNRRRNEDNWQPVRALPEAQVVKR